MTVGDLLAQAEAAGVRIATAESCTGGMVAAALTDIAGSSRVIERGFVTYSNAAKRELLGVSAEALDQFGAVSEEVAREMAFFAWLAGRPLPQNLYIESSRGPQGKPPSVALGSSGR